MSPRPRAETLDAQSSSESDYSQLVLRRVRKWFLTLNPDLAESEPYSALWLELRDTERKLFTGTSLDVSDIEAVIETAIQLGYSSRLESK